MALTVIAGACLEGWRDCGDDVCPTSLTCVEDIKKGIHACVDPDEVNTCGNELVEVGEVCDDGNDKSGDGCSSDCLSAERCGDGVLEATRGEMCDCGADDFHPMDPRCNGKQNGADPSAYCSSNCTKAACGNGMVDDGEKCDTRVTVTTSCVDLRYDFGRPGCTAACDGLSPDPCGDWNWRAQETGTLSDLLSVWGTSNDDIFAVGDDGTIVHHDGQRWQTMESPTSEMLDAVWGSGPDNVFAVGYNGTILRYRSSMTRGSCTGA
ncbi:hypothetical protein WMF37_20630 [Sorangium sp. So ce291]|uniref:hypothetical protein n=1 Tax=Sorangium sp. So ce291 TaxID=3133294 RepID=UPI003F5F5A87